MDNHEHNSENHQKHGARVASTRSSLAAYAPLFIIIILLIAFAWIMSVRTPNTDWQFAMRMFMGGFFAVFGLLKIIKIKAFAIAYRQYDVIAKRSWAYAYLYPFLELSFALAYFMAWNLETTNWIVFVVMLVSTVGVAQKLAKREVVPCACLGTVFKVPMTYVTLVENLGMAAMAAIMLFA